MADAVGDGDSHSQRLARTGTDSGLLRHDQVLAELVRRLVAAYEPERIFLFGSKARGDADADSDYDLLLVVPDDASPDRLSGKLAYEVLWDVAAAVDAVIWTRTAFERRARVPASLPAKVLREGTLLHAA